MVSITFTDSNGTARTVEGEEGSTLMETAIGIATSVLALAAANGKLRTLAGVLERLGAQGRDLQVMLDDVEKRFGGFNAAMDEQIGAFQGALGTVSGHIEHINANASRALNEVNGVAAPMTSHHETITDRADHLAQTQGDLDLRLGARQAAMETLLTTVAAKHEDFENLTRSFSGLVEDSFRKAEARARDIGAFLSEQMQSSTGLIDEQLAAIRDNEGKEEREHTAAALRTAYDQAAHELEDLFGKSTQRFQTAAAEMRGLSQTIQEELATTREDVRRNVIELPRETSEQAMRGVVGEHVRALGDLADIITRSGRSLDVSLPQSPTPQLREVQAAPARLETVRREPEQAVNEAAQEAARQEAARQEAARQEAARQETVRQETARQEQARQHQARAEAATETQMRQATSAPNGQAQGGQSWMSDLLARASKDEGLREPPSARVNGYGGEPFDAISMDFARMVDQNAAADAWERYRRGEDEAFDISIYKGRGAQTFEEIRRRYKVDDRFRTTVDRFVQQFERILSQIPDDDPDDRVLRDYLGSDSGRVYTMLAHAAERIA